MKVECYDKKYTWVFDEKTGRLTCLRYGEEWRDETGDGAILALLQKCDDLQTALNSDYTKCTRIEQPENKSDSSKYMKCPKCGKFTSQQSKNFNGSWCINEDCLHEFYFA